jgi:hypothetical protein
MPQPDPEAVQKELDTLWNDLHSTDELTVARAMFRLFAYRNDTVSYLNNRLQPLKLSKERLNALLADLASDNDKKAQAAYNELAYFDPRLALDDEALQDLLLNDPAARRLGDILCDLPINTLVGPQWHWCSPDRVVLRFNDTHAKITNRDAAIAVANIGHHGVNKKQWLSAMRAVAVLEQIGTPEAIAVIERFAGGHPDAEPTKAARRVLERLKKK